MIKIINFYRGKRKFRKKLGYTIAELVVVALIGTILIGIAARWVGQLGQVALQQVATGVQSNAIIATDRLEDDLTAAVQCNPWGTDSPLAEITNSSLTIFADINGTGTPTLVKWSVDTESGVLTRSESELGSDCSIIASGNDVAMLTGVATGGAAAPLFIPSINGVLATNEAAYGLCENSYAQRCQIDSIQVELTVLDAGSPINVTYHIPIGV